MFCLVVGDFSWLEPLLVGVLYVVGLIIALFAFSLCGVVFSFVLLFLVLFVLAEDYDNLIVNWLDNVGFGGFIIICV